MLPRLISHFCALLIFSDLSSWVAKTSKCCCTWQIVHMAMCVLVCAQTKSRCSSCSLYLELLIVSSHHLLSTGVTGMCRMCPVYAVLGTKPRLHARQVLYQLPDRNFYLIHYLNITYYNRTKKLIE